MDTVALLLAAGDGLRFGEDKRFIGVPPLLERTLHSLYSAFDRIVMVHKATDDLSRLQIDSSKVILVAHDKTSDASLGGSISKGIDRIINLETPPELCAIFLADMPFIQEETLINLIQFAEKKCLETSCKTTICRPKFENGIGHPVIFSSTLFSALSLLNQQDGAKAVIKLNKKNYYEFECTDSGVCIDIDTLDAAKRYGIFSSNV